MSVFLEDQADAEAILAALDAEVVHLTLMLEMQFKSGTIYISNQTVPFIDARWGREWIGMGDLVGLADVMGGENDLAPFREYVLGIPWELIPEGQEAGLGRIPALLSQDRSEFVGRAAILYAQVFSRVEVDEHGRPIPIGQPFTLDHSVMDRVSAQYSAGAAVLTMTVEGLFARKRVPPHGTLTDRDQRSRYADDKGMRFVPEVMTTNFKWTTW